MTAFKYQTTPTTIVTHAITKDDSNSSHSAYYGTSDATVEVGKSIKVNYSGGVSMLEGYQYFMGYSIDNQDKFLELKKTSEAPTAPVEGSLTLDAANTDRMTVWFEARKEGTTTVYDSNNGGNYTVHILNTKSKPIKKVCFSMNPSWKIAAPQSLKQGDIVSVVYDTDRLFSQLRCTTYNGYPAYTLTGHYQVTGANNTVIDSADFPLQTDESSRTGSGTGRIAFSAKLPLPQGAEKLIFWFTGSDRAGSAWDSDYGKNYIFTVEK